MSNSEPSWTTTAPRDDLSHGTSGTSSETALFSALRNARTLPARRTEDCACGGEIVAEYGWEAARIDEHNLTPQHQAWRAWLKETWQ